MSEVVDLQSVRRGRDRNLFDAHNRALAELVSAFAIHAVSGECLDRLLAAQEAYVNAWLALERKS
jgi:hypothetical protein